MNIITKGFGKNLKEVRRSKKITQENLSEQIGINLRQLARIEAGESFITAETLLNICKVLEISPGFLFNFSVTEEKNEKIKSKEYELIKDKLVCLAHNKSKLEFVILAINALENKKALTQLKYLIKGIELSAKM